jgi:hypothetical protein
MNTAVTLKVTFKDNRPEDAAAWALVEHLFETYNGDSSLLRVEPICPHCRRALLGKESTS